MEEFKDYSSKGSQINRVLALELSQSWILTVDVCGVSDNIQFFDLQQECWDADFICSIKDGLFGFAVEKEQEQIVHLSRASLGQGSFLFNQFLLLGRISEHPSDAPRDLID